MARKIVAGNWKMNLMPEEGLQLIHKISDYCREYAPEALEVIVAPPMLYLSQAAQGSDNSKLLLAAQNCSDSESGAHTGEVSPQMIKAAKVDFVIIGHSERRHIYGESDEFINRKVKQALKTGLQPILCVGESLDNRKANKHEEVVRQQLDGALRDIKGDELQNLIIAYEPVWAIGTGGTASPEQAQEMHAFIRGHIGKQFDEKLASRIGILYGGSVKPANAKEIFSQKDVDGGLIGGASLDYSSFVKLIETGKECLV